MRALGTQIPVRFTCEKEIFGRQLSVDNPDSAELLKVIKSTLSTQSPPIFRVELLS
jgi:hypothetical protein